MPAWAAPQVSDEQSQAGVVVLRAAQLPVPLVPGIRFQVYASRATASASLSARSRAKPLVAAIRVARRRVVIVTIDPEVESKMWLFAEYVPEAPRRTQLSSHESRLHGWLGPQAENHVLLVPRDCTDGFLLCSGGIRRGVLNADARKAPRSPPPRPRSSDGASGRPAPRPRT